MGRDLPTHAEGERDHQAKIAELKHNAGLGREKQQQKSGHHREFADTTEHAPNNSIALYIRKRSIRKHTAFPIAHRNSFSMPRPYHLSAEARAKLSARMKRRQADPEVAARRVATFRAARQLPGQQAHRNPLCPCRSSERFAGRPEGGRIPCHCMQTGAGSGPRVGSWPAPKTNRGRIRQRTRPGTPNTPLTRRPPPRPYPLIGFYLSRC